MTAKRIQTLDTWILILVSCWSGSESFFFFEHLSPRYYYLRKTFSFHLQWGSKLSEWKTVCLPKINDAAGSIEVLKSYVFVLRCLVFLERTWGERNNTSQTQGQKRKKTQMFKFEEIFNFISRKEKKRNEALFPHTTQMLIVPNSFFIQFIFGVQRLRVLFVTLRVHKWEGVRVVSAVLLLQLGHRLLLAGVLGRSNLQW